MALGRLIVNLSMPSEVKAEKVVYEYTEPEESCAERLWEYCYSEDLTREQCAVLIERECPKVRKQITYYSATIEGTGLITKEGVFPARGLSKLDYRLRVEGEAPRPEVNYYINPPPELDVPFQVIFMCSWDEKPPSGFYDATLVLEATLSGLVTKVSGKGRATTRVKFPRR
jgi:hypothetical protein